MRMPSRAPETHFNFELGAWVVGGKFIHCGMRGDGPCQCYGCQHEGERETAETELRGDVPKTPSPAHPQVPESSRSKFAENSVRETLVFGTPEVSA